MKISIDPMRALLRAAFCTTALLGAGLAQAQVDVSGAWIRGTVPGQQATGAFMTLRAQDGAKLIGVSTPAAGTVEIHEMKMDGNTMKMRALPGIDLPKARTVELKPGGYHLMLLDLKRPLKKGETVPLTLSFEQPGKPPLTQRIDAEVRDLTAGPPTANHATHQH